MNENKIISYERLLEIARKMHTWIFCNTGDEQAVYDELGITEEENVIFGYSGNFKFEVTEKEIKCKECKHLMFSDCYGECSKGFKGIVRPDDSCPYGERKEVTENE